MRATPRRSNGQSPSFIFIFYFLFIFSFQETAAIAGWHDNSTLLVAGHKLTDKAKRWYNLRRPFPSVAVFLQQLQEQYPVPSLADAIAKLRRCKLKPGESVPDYAVRFEALAQYAQVPD